VFSFMAIFLSIWVALYVLFLFVVKLSQREKVDPVFKGKMQGIRIRWDPRIKLFENIFAWALVILFIYFIYLG
jgi:predicted secreted protein